MRLRLSTCVSRRITVMGSDGFDLVRQVAKEADL